MKNIFTISTLLILISSCASHYQRPESIQEKMARFQAREDGINRVPDYYAPTQVNFKTKGRTPASTKSKKDMSLSYNNKKLYFLTLYGQYSALQAYSNHSAPTINICPNFHTTFLNFKEKVGRGSWQKSPIESISYKTTHLNDKNFLALNPELALPVTSENVHPRVKDVIGLPESGGTTELVMKALDIHLTKTYNEVKELCEHGHSDNYYIFENLMTHIKQQSEFNSSEKNLKFLMKTTLYSNMALIKSFKKFPKRKLNKGPSRGIASVKEKNDEVFSGEVIKRLNADWSQGFLENIGSK